MAKSLGIFVTTDQNMNHIIGITKAATAKGSKVKVFFTWKATKLAQQAGFKELCDLAEVSICADSYKKMGFDPVDDLPEGMVDTQMSTQAQHGQMIDDYDCYVTL